MFRFHKEAGHRFPVPCRSLAVCWWSLPLHYFRCSSKRIGPSFRCPIFLFLSFFEKSAKISVTFDSQKLITRVRNKTERSDPKWMMRKSLLSFGSETSRPFKRFIVCASHIYYPPSTIREYCFIPVCSRQAVVSFYAYTTTAGELRQN